MKRLLEAAFLLACCSLLTVSSDTKFDQSAPHLYYNVSEAVISRCQYTSLDTIQLVENDRQLVVVHSSDSHVTVLASNLSRSFSSLGLINCIHVGHVSDIVSQTDELSNQNQHGITKRNILKTLGVHWFERYHNLSAIYQWHRLLASNYPMRVHLVDSIGKTQQGKDIMAVHISDWTTAAGDKPKAKVYLQCLLHAREWITGPVCMYTAWNLVITTSPNVAELLKRVEFIIVPVANPDGYELTWFKYPKYRFWRKNVARSSAGSKCAGVDLNRNFNTHWSEFGSSADPCSETYHGALAESESEVQSVTQHLKKNVPVIGGIDFHSFSQIVVYPYGWTKKVPDNARELKRSADEFASRASQFGKRYTAHQMSSIYVASGTFGDWLFSDMFQDHNTDSSGSHVSVVPLTVELRPEDDDTVTYTSFMIPPSQILPSCQEMFPAVVNFVSHLLDKQRP